MSKKPLIVFEGIEGSGKSYHILNISRYLTKKKIDHIKLREPGGSLNAEKIILIEFMILTSMKKSYKCVIKQYAKLQII